MGWHDTNGAPGPEFFVTRGNNVHAYTDIDADNAADPGSDPAGGGTLTFDFPIDLALQPATCRPAAVTNLFYWNNVVHDVMHEYGFNDASGNTQVNSYGKGGLGNDDVGTVNESQRWRRSVRSARKLRPVEAECGRPIISTGKQMRRGPGHAGASRCVFQPQATRCAFFRFE